MYSACCLVDTRVLRNVVRVTMQDLLRDGWVVMVAAAATADAAASARVADNRVGEGGQLAQQAHSCPLPDRPSFFAEDVHATL